MTHIPPIAGVIGAPIAHSRSPRLHAHWLARYRINGYYLPFLIDAPALGDCLTAFARLNFRGLNVTLPHKEAVLALARTASVTARRIGAANTLTFLPGGGFHAENTDAAGFLANIRDAAPGWTAAAGPALVLGAGGASRAVIVALLDDGAPEVRIANRSRARAEALAGEFGERLRVVDWPADADAVCGATTIVNTTSLGMDGRSGPDLALEAAQADAVVADIVYQPFRTDLLRRAAARGLYPVDGLGMLLHQAAPGFEAWFGVRPDVDADLRHAVLAP